MSKIRTYAFERDDQGLPTKMIWLGDYQAPHKQTQAEKEGAKLAEHERIYGKRER